MIGSQAVAEVQQILGWRSDKAAEILSALQYSQAQREKPGMTFPWWMKVGYPFSTVAVQHAYNVPTNFIQETDFPQGNLFRLFPNGSRTYLTRLNAVEAEAFYRPPDDPQRAVARGAPKQYVLDAGSFYIYPIADAVYSMFWVYWGKADLITLSAENSWLREAPWVLIGEAALKLGMDIENANAVSTARAILDKATGDMFRSAIHREETGRKRHMGSKL